MKTADIAYALISIAITAPAAPAVRLRVAGVPHGETPAFTRGDRIEVVAENVSGAPLELVPYGCAKLRVSMFPDEAAQ